MRQTAGHLNALLVLPKLTSPAAVEALLIVQPAKHGIVTGMMTTVEQADMATGMTDMMTETGAMTDTRIEVMIDMMTTAVVRQHLCLV